MGRRASAAARHILGLAPGAADLEAAIRTVVGRLIENVPSPPTDLSMVAPRLRITRVVPADIPVSGELRSEGEGFAVFHARHQSRARVRFTIAHEMGHAIFETTSPRPPRRGAELERICDRIATEILMPSSTFGACLNEALNLARVAALADEFDTSITATAIRVAELSSVSFCEIAAGKVRWSRGPVTLSDYQCTEWYRHVVYEHASTFEALVDIGGHRQPSRVEARRLGTDRVLFMAQRLRGAPAIPATVADWREIVRATWATGPR